MIDSDAVCEKLNRQKIWYIYFLFVMLYLSWTFSTDTVALDLKQMAVVFPVSNTLEFTITSHEFYGNFSGCGEKQNSSRNMSPQTYRIGFLKFHIHKFREK